MTAPPPQWGPPPPGGGATPPQAQWGPAPQSSWGAPPPPQWAAPDAGPYGAAPVGPRHPIVSTVAAHLVLWLGLILVAVVSPQIARYAYRSSSLPVEFFQATLALFAALPVAVALVLAGRSTSLRLAGLIGGVVLLLGNLLLGLVRFGPSAWVLTVALSVVGLGTWIAARRHAPWGYLVLVPGAVLAYLWFHTDVTFDLRHPYRQGVRSTTLVYLWGDLPIIALAVLGLVSSVLRPKPSPEHDGRGLLVAAGLAGVAVIAAVVAFVLRA